jgi:hypothetical protein
VPITWPCAQRTAARLIEQASTSPPVTASFEYRATHDVLAVTILLASAATAAKDPCDDQLRAMKALLEHDVEWALWCSDVLSQAPVHLSVTDLGPAISAWTWLTRTCLLSESLSHGPGACTVAATHPGAGLSIGVALARQSLSAISSSN